MRFLMIKIDRDEKVEMEYEEQIGGTYRKQEVDSVEPPTPAFVAALRGLQKHLPVVTDAPSDYLATAEVRSFTLSYNKNDQRSAKLNAVRPVKHSNSPLLLNAPGIVETEEVREGSVLEGVDTSIGSIRGVFEAIEDVIAHARAFLDGARGEEKKAAPKTDPGQTTIEEHISEADRTEATKAFLAVMGEKPANIGSSNKQLTMRIVHTFDGVTFVDKEGDPDARRVPGLYAHKLADEEGNVVRYIWCRVDAAADIPKFWYDTPADTFDAAAHAPTFVGFQMVKMLREAWGMNDNGKAPAKKLNNIAGTVDKTLAAAGA